jgi:hypothetical protein
MSVQRAMSVGCTTRRQYCTNPNITFKSVWLNQYLSFTGECQIAMCVGYVALAVLRWQKPAVTNHQQSTISNNGESCGQHTKARAETSPENNHSTGNHFSTVHPWTSDQ